MKTVIVTDSTCDLPQDLLSEHNIHIVPALLILQGKSYADGEGISRQDFYARLSELRPSPTTAAPSAGEFSALYKKLFSQGYERILSIHAAGELTAIINSARLAAQDFPNQITIVDSGSLSMGLGLQVLVAARAVEKALSLQKIQSSIRAAQKGLVVRASIDSLEYLKRSGRLPSFIAKFGNFFSIKPLIALESGRLKPLGAGRTTQQGNQRLAEMLLECGLLEYLAIMHSNAEERAHSLLDLIMQTAPQHFPREILKVLITPVIGTHVGPGALGFAAVKKQLEK